MRQRVPQWGRVTTFGLAAWFVTISITRLTATWQVHGVDIRLYLAGTRAWLAGEDPWSVHIGELYFAAAPPSLLPIVPFALLPEPLAIAAWTALSIAASFWTLRKLELPWWWISFPPLVDTLWNGNPQILLVPLLIGPLAWLAPIVKAYGFVPMLIHVKIRSLAVAAIAVIVSLPLLPWLAFVDHLAATMRLLSEQSQGGMSAWFVPVLVPPASAALIVMGRKRAAWWFIPALWPSTQWYYSLMALPALTPVTAAILAAPVQGGPAVAAIVAAAEVWFLRRRARIGTGSGSVAQATPGPGPT